MSISYFSRLASPSACHQQKKKSKKYQNNKTTTHTGFEPADRQKAHVPEGPLPNPSWYTLTLLWSVQRPEFRLHWGFWDFLTLWQIIPLRHTSRVNSIGDNYEYNLLFFFSLNTQDDSFLNFCLSLFDVVKVLAYREYTFHYY